MELLEKRIGLSGGMNLFLIFNPQIKKKVSWFVILCVLLSVVL